MIPAILLLLLLLPGVCRGAALPAELAFADSLAAEGEHYRAITEYKRFIFLQPDSPLLPRARLSIAASLLKGQRWTQADSSLEELFRLYPASAAAENGRLLYADSAYERGEYGLARQRYQLLLSRDSAPARINYANLRIGWTLLEEDSPEQALAHFRLLPAAEQAQLSTDIEQYQKLKLKSPLVAGTLSAVLPGLGQIYTGRLRQAALAFLLNGAFILGAVEAFRDDNYAVGGILLLFEVGWYGGNVYNAANNAEKYNARVKNRFKREMRSRLNLQLGMLPRTPMVSLNYRF
jgi:tetratricopeptide (TPR) repeat protein